MKDATTHGYKNGHGSGNGSGDGSGDGSGNGNGSGLGLEWNVKERNDWSFLLLLIALSHSALLSSAKFLMGFKDCIYLQGVHGSFGVSEQLQLCISKGRSHDIARAKRMAEQT